MKNSIKLSVLSCVLWTVSGNAGLPEEVTCDYYPFHHKFFDSDKKVRLKKSKANFFDVIGDNDVIAYALLPFVDVKTCLHLTKTESRLRSLTVIVLQNRMKNVNTTAYDYEEKANAYFYGLKLEKFEVKKDTSKAFAILEQAKENEYIDPKETKKSPAGLMNILNTITKAFIDKTDYTDRLCKLLPDDHPQHAKLKYNKMTKTHGSSAAQATAFRACFN